MAYRELTSTQLRRTYIAKPQEVAKQQDAATLPGAKPADVSTGISLNDTDLHQPRALQALDFGMHMKGPGYNVYALGGPRNGMRDFVLSNLTELAASAPVANDLCYVANLDKPSEPISIELPAGLGKQVREDIKHLLSNLTTTIKANFNSDEFRNQMTDFLDTFRMRQEKDHEELKQEALGMNILMLATPNGFAFAPQKDGKVLSNEELEKLSKEESDAYTEAAELLTEKLRSRLMEYPALQQDILKNQRSFAEDSAKKVLAALTSQFRSRYQSHTAIIRHVDAISADLLSNIDMLIALGAEVQNPNSGTEMMPEQLQGYEINLLLDRADDKEAPVVYESNPSLENLVGKLEHRLEYGSPVTDYSLIRAGALHRANGGYLVLEIERLLSKPFAWEALKRALSDGCIRIESVNQLLSMAYSVSLDPAPVPLNVKVILLGPRRIYHLLREYDSDFDSQFKVLADFADEITWTDDNEHAYANELHELIQREHLRELETQALGRVIEHGSRLVSDQQHLTAHTEELFDLVREADSFAGNEKATAISCDHVEQAIAARIYRVDRIKELVLQSIERGQTVVSTRGSRVGQINGLSVMQLGKLVFGQPSRITATARLGRGEVIDIERESKLGGNIHTKAVMIVANFIGYRYAREHPLSLHASLVFEQSYGGIEGDSASIAEVCALLSALTDIPLRQDIAVTGSMDQHGTVQAIGGINEKIEGFFDVCKAGTLTGSQGVLFPASNTDNLMLRSEVIEAVDQGNFHIHTMTDVNDALSIMFGNEDGPADVTWIEKQVKDRLKQLYKLWQQAQNPATTQDEA